VRCSFFLHTAFPASAVWASLPWSRALLRGVLAADVVGFHTPDYARHFASAAVREVGAVASAAGVARRGHLTRVAAEPIGVDFAALAAAARAPKLKFKAPAGGGGAGAAADALERALE